MRTQIVVRSWRVVAMGRLTFNQRVVGSIPTALTNKIKDLSEISQAKKSIWLTNS